MVALSPTLLVVLSDGNPKSADGSIGVRPKSVELSLGIPGSVKLSDGRAPSAPAAARVAKNTRVSHHESTGITRHSRTRMVLTVSFVLSPGTGLSCPRRFAEDSTKLDASVGASGPHDFAVRRLARTSARRQRPSHPAP